MFIYGISFQLNIFHTLFSYIIQANVKLMFDVKCIIQKKNNNPISWWMRWYSIINFFTTNNFSLQLPMVSYKLNASVFHVSTNCVAIILWICGLLLKFQRKLRSYTNRWKDPLWKRFQQFIHQRHAFKRFWMADIASMWIFGIKWLTDSRNWNVINCNRDTCIQTIWRFESARSKYPLATSVTEKDDGERGRERESELNFSVAVKCRNSVGEHIIQNVDNPK